MAEKKAPPKSAQVQGDIPIAKSITQCVESLSSDFLRIKRDHIDKGNFAEALADWGNSLFTSNFDEFKASMIGGITMGVKFVACVGSLTQALDGGDKSSIEYRAKDLLVCIRQRNLRDECLRREDDSCGSPTHGPDARWGDKQW